MESVSKKFSSGKLSILVTLRPDDRFTAMLTSKDVHEFLGRLSPSEHMKRTCAIDSMETFTAIAKSALSFATEDVLHLIDVDVDGNTVVTCEELENA